MSNVSAVSGPIELFYAYSHQDEYFRNELEKHLSILQHRGLIANWHDHRIAPGSEWAGQIGEHLETAQVILLLVSADFLASQYCYDIEVKRALERHEAGQATVIPIILRPVFLGGAPFAKLQALPKDGKPVASWDNQDEAFKNIVEGIWEAIRGINVKRSPPAIDRNSFLLASWILVATIAAISVIGLIYYYPNDTSKTDDARVTVSHERQLPPGCVWIKPGEFMMGSPETEPHRIEGEVFERQHRMVLTEGFYLGKYEVTQAQYEEVMGENPSRFKNAGSSAPVETVSWDNAMEFCRRLTERHHASGKLPDGFVYTLPTDAQWEYACRAGNQGAYCFGDDESQLKDYAWFNENSEWQTHPVGKTQTHPVGKKQPNAWGLYDMHGNVSEWCSEWSGDGPKLPRDNPIGPSKVSARVGRGGCWCFPAGLCRSAFRYWPDPGYRSVNQGFRVAAVRPGSKTNQ